MFKNLVFLFGTLMEPSIILNMNLSENAVAES